MDKIELKLNDIDFLINYINKKWIDNFNKIDDLEDKIILDDYQSLIFKKDEYNNLNLYWEIIRHGEIFKEIKLIDYEYEYENNLIKIIFILYWIIKNKIDGDYKSPWSKLVNEIDCYFIDEENFSLTENLEDCIYIRLPVWKLLNILAQLKNELGNIQYKYDLNLSVEKRITEKETKQDKICICRIRKWYGTRIVNYWEVMKSRG